MADVSLSTLRGEPRRKIVTLTASDSSVAIPSWAQGGKGIVYVTGCGAGGGGRTSTGASGGQGAWARDFQVLIPQAVSTMNCVIGAGGAAGTNGGSTTVTIAGTTVLSLGGGHGGETGQNGRGGNGGTANVSGVSARLLSRTSYTGPATVRDLMGSVLATWVDSHQGRVGDGVYGAYPSSSTAFTDAITNDSGGVPLLGFYGKGGGLGAAGQSGVLMLEFVEGF